METNRQKTQGTEMAPLSTLPQHPGRVLHIWDILKIFVDQWQAKQTLESVLAISKAIKKKKNHKAMERHVHFIYAVASGEPGHLLSTHNSLNTSSVKLYNQMLNGSNVPQASILCTR